MQHGKRHGQGLRVIGIDGGGTKTVCVLGDGEGHLIAGSRGESSSLTSRPWEEVTRVLLSLIRDVLAQSGTEPSELSGVFLGLAGSDRPEDREQIKSWLEQELPESVSITVHNDAVTALIAGTWGEKGIALISGTGSIAYGFDPATGQFVRVGGWGYLLGDEGSGYDLGRKALAAVMKAYDGRGRPTALTKLVLDHLSLHDPAQLIRSVYGQTNVRTAIAEGSKLVMQAASEGDAVAVELVEDAIRELEALVRRAAEAMGIPLLVEPAEGGETGERAVPLVLSGGLFSDPVFERTFRETPLLRSGAFDIRLLMHPPVVGAYMLALRQQGCELTEGIKEQIGAFDVQRLWNGSSME